MNWATQLRLLAAGLGSLALFSCVVTQMIAALLDYHPTLGEPVLTISEARLYPPWAFVQWGLDWAPHAPGHAVLIAMLAALCVLASHSAAMLWAGLAPVAPQRSRGRDLIGWRDLSDRGLLGDEGLALGALCRHVLAKPDFVRLARGPCLVVGDPVSTDDSLLAAVAGWRGALVMIDARGVSGRLARRNVLRVAPGCSESASINPLLAIRGGAHAWGDAKRLAEILLPLSDLQADQGVPVEALALMMLDQLLTAPMEARTLGALRRRLIHRHALIGELLRRWSAYEVHAELPPPAWEMARAAPALNDEQILACFDLIDSALSLFGEAEFADVTASHHLRFGDLLDAESPQTLVISLDPDDAERAAPLVLAILAQLAATCAAGLGARHRLLVVIEAEATRALAHRINLTRHGGEPGAIARLAALRACDLFIQAAEVADAESLVRGLGVRRDAPFEAVLAVGAQTQTSARALGELGGSFETYQPRAACASGLGRSFRLPRLERVSLRRLPAEALTAAGPSEAFLMLRNAKPARVQVLAAGAGAASFVPRDQLAPAPHDWSGPPLVRCSGPSAGGRTDAVSRPGIPSAKLRRILSRTIVPKSRPDPKHSGVETE